MKKTLICITCPLGCNLEIEYDKEQILDVKCAGCKRGIKYAEQEIFNPKRVVTSTVKIAGNKIALLPVKTDVPVPTNLMSKVMGEIFHIKVKVPVRLGDIISENVANSGANLVATRTLI